VGPFDPTDVVETDEERDDADEPKAAVDETPVWRDVADGSGDESEGDDAGTGNNAELEYPLVADWVDEGTDERDGNDEVGESEPVRSIGHEAVGPVGLDDSIVNAAEPGIEGEFAGGWRHWGDSEYPVQEGGFGLEGKGSDATEDESNNEEDEPDADTAKKVGWGIGRHKPV
jgi:hypothetical protein